MKEELLKGLSEEQINKARKCKSQEELLALAKEEGIELSDEQLTAVNGGFCSDTTVSVVCPKCGASVKGQVHKSSAVKELGKFTCKNCGHTWKELVEC